METTFSVRLLLAAAPRSPGAMDIVRRALDVARAGSAVSILLSGDGLDWLSENSFLEDARTASAALALCSRSVRDRKIDPLAVPAGVQWSSLVSWFLEDADGAATWTVLP